MANRVKSSIKKLVLHPEKVRPKKKRDGYTYGRTWGLSIVPFVNELLYANYVAQLSDPELVAAAEAEFPKLVEDCKARGVRPFQEMTRYRSYFNTNKKETGQGIGFYLSGTKYRLPQFAAGKHGKRDIPIPKPRFGKQLESSRSSGGATSHKRKRPPLRIVDSAALEGIKTEIKQIVSKRSRRLRDSAIRASNGCCEACRVDYSRLLGGRGKRVLQVHHCKQLSSLKMPKLTKREDLAVVCANCHLLLHIDPKHAMKVETLRKLLGKNRLGNITSPPR